MIIYGEDDLDNDDDIVSNKFRETKGKMKGRRTDNSGLFKNVE